MHLSKGANVTEQNLPPLPPSLMKPLKVKNDRTNNRASISIKMTLEPLRRGYVHLTGMIIARPDPFGLVKAPYTINVSDSLLVLPKRYPVGEISLSGSRKYQRGGVNLAMSVGDSEEFISLREYRPGDPLRHIHWKSWAKIGKPVVKEFQDEFFVRHALILDTFTEQATGDIFETAVSVAASFACAPRSHEVLLDLMFAGTQTYCFTSGRGLANTDKLLLDWDTPRQHFIQSLKNLGLPLLVTVISSTELEIDHKAFPEVHVLPLNAIADALVKLS